MRMVGAPIETCKTPGTLGNIPLAGKPRFVAKLHRYQGPGLISPGRSLWPIEPQAYGGRTQTARRANAARPHQRPGASQLTSRSPSPFQEIPATNNVTEKHRFLFRCAGKQQRVWRFVVIHSRSRRR